MYYIYKISNKVNSKVYIGQTAFGIEKRFNEHIHKAMSGNYNHRPLYSAMNKYGIENFYIELVETGDSKQWANDREKYWISKYNSFKGEGYNATIGGDDGATHSFEVIQISMDTLEIVGNYESTHDAARTMGKINNAPICRVCNGAAKSIYGFYWCYAKDFDTYMNGLLSGEKLSVKISKQVEQYDLSTNEVIKSFESAWAAENELGVTHGHIKRVCNGERKSFKGFGWRFVA